MKILQVMPYAQLGGTEKAVSLLSKGLKERGIDVTLLAPEGPSLALFDGIRIEFLPPSHFQRKKMISSLLESHDLVHIHAARELVKEYKKPVVFTPHSYYNKLDRLMVTLFAKRAQIICFTKWEKRMLQRLGLEKIAVIPNGIEPPPFLSKTTENTPLKLGYLGRLTKDKGLDLLFKELVKLKEPYELLIAGEGKEKEYLKDLAKTHSIPVTFLGYQDTYSFLKIIDIFVLPSRTETFGLALIEAMSQGLCCVAADVCGLKEILQDAGLVASHNKLAAHLEKVIRDKGLRESLGKKARERFNALYTEDKMIKETEKLYLSLLKE